MRQRTGEVDAGDLMVESMMIMNKTKQFSFLITIFLIKVTF